MRRAFLAVVLVLAVVFVDYGLASAATIYTTNSTDTLNTFLANVNASLTNLNAALGGQFAFSTNFGKTSAATSSPLWAQDGLFASSTSQFVNATSSELTVSGDAWLLNSKSGVLKTNSSGLVSVAANGTDYTLITANTCGSGQFFNAATAAGVFTCGTSAVATSSTEAFGQIPWWTTNGGTPAKLWGGDNGFEFSTSSSYSTLLVGEPGNTGNPGRIELQVYNGVASAITYLTALNNTTSAVTSTLPPVTGTLAAGTGTTNQVSYWSGTNTLTSSSNLTFNGSLLDLTGNASTTQLSAASQKFYVDSTGKITGYDTKDALSGTISPVSVGGFKLATTTTWTGTTSEPYSFDFAAPFTGTINYARCYTDTGTLDIQISDGATSKYVHSASTTVGKYQLGLSMTEGDKLKANAGNPAASPTWVTCSLFGTRS